jgi:hypothetical protein
VAETPRARRRPEAALTLWPPHGIAAPAAILELCGDAGVTSWTLSRAPAASISLPPKSSDAVPLSALMPSEVARHLAERSLSVGEKASAAAAG